jgi:hypothetical protein
MEEKEHNYPLVYIEWKDIMQDDGRWKSLDDAQEWIEETNNVMKQTGFVVSLDDGCIGIAQTLNFHEDESLRMVSVVQKIPKEAIIKAKLIEPDKLKEHKLWE